MALSSSSNKHESELAMIKAQQLLLKHNIESKYRDVDDGEKVYLKRYHETASKNGENVCDSTDF